MSNAWLAVLLIGFVIEGYGFFWLKHRNDTATAKEKQAAEHLAEARAEKELLLTYIREIRDQKNGLDQARIDQLAEETVWGVLKDINRRVEDIQKANLSERVKALEDQWRSAHAAAGAA